MANPDSEFTLNRYEMTAIAVLVGESWAASYVLEKDGHDARAEIVRSASDELRAVLRRAGIWGH